MLLSRLALAPLPCWLIAAGCLAAQPRVLLEGVQLEQIAAEPDIVTPIGVAFDPHGRLLVVESHTHQRPEGYQGPAGDRLRMFSDSDGDGRLDRWSTFAEGFQQAMNVCARPDGGVYVVTRRDVRLLEDRDHDGVAEHSTQILRLETEAEYPHNGLSGIHWTRDEENQETLYLGLGENFGFPYQLVGSDGGCVAGSGGVGTVFSCRPDGSKLARFAVGFWNPFSLATAAGRLYCVDNDPDASPPCRLIEVLYGGDYGHRWEYGRAGVHPLQAWNGELPGTLPMICGTGEAPTAVVLHRGALWVTSWGDHRIERYELETAPRSAGVTARLTTVVQGDADFRPTGMAEGPDGALYFADWVDKSYPVHGHGRLWRLETSRVDYATPPVAGSARTNSAGQYLADPYARQRIVQGLFGEARRDMTSLMHDPQPEWRLAVLQACRFGSAIGGERLTELLRGALLDSDRDVRLYAVRWIADERIKELRDSVAALLDGPIPDERYFLGVLAAIDWLDGDGAPRHSGIGDGLLARELRNKSRSPELHALALRLISPDHKEVTLDALRQWLESPSAELRREAVRTLAMQSNPARFALLREAAADATLDADVRATAVVGLAAAGEAGDAALELLAGDANAVVAAEVQRMRRLGGKLPPIEESKPPAADLAAWEKLLAEGGDPAAGRRLFFAPVGPQCANCHQHSGRGGRIGPDLSKIGAQQSRKRVIASILQPSREIAPQYQAWTLATADGKAHLGLKLPQGGDNGQESYADPTGRTFTLASDDIELRSPSTESIMPAGLEQTMSIGDLRDLLAFLMETGGR